MMVGSLETHLPLVHGGRIINSYITTFNWPWCLLIFPCSACLTVRFCGLSVSIHTLTHFPGIRIIWLCKRNICILNKILLTLLALCGFGFSIWGHAINELGVGVSLICGGRALIG